MLNLIKYEWLRKVRYLLFTLIALVVIEAVTLFLIYNGEDKIGFAILLIVLTFIGIYFVILIDNIYMLSSDLYKKSGYMLFMTPNSSYKIIGSKLIFGTIEAIVAYSIVYGMTYFNLKTAYDLYYRTNDSFQSFIDTVSGFIKIEGFGLTIIAAVLISTALNWLILISTAYLSSVLRKSFLANVKAGWFVTILFFFVINIAQSMISNAIMVPFTTALYGSSGIESKIESGVFDLWDIFPPSIIIVTIVTSIGFIALNYFATCYLMEKKLEL